jgi:hypothetical protein
MGDVYRRGLVEHLYLDMQFIEDFNIMSGSKERFAFVIYLGILATTHPSHSPKPRLARALMRVYLSLLRVVIVVWIVKP